MPDFFSPSTGEPPRPVVCSSSTEPAVFSRGAVWLLRLWLLPGGACPTALWALLLQHCGKTALWGPLLATALYLLFLLWYPPRYLRCRHLRVAKHCLTAITGVFWRRTSCLPLASVRRVTRFSTPLSRLLRCRCLSLHYPGGRLLMAALPGDTAVILEATLAKEVS